MDIFEEIEETLVFLNSRIGRAVEWAVDGSTSLVLQGIDVEPNDIDILTDKDGAVAIASVFEEFVQKSLSYGVTEKYRSYFCILKIKKGNRSVLCA